MDIFVKDGEKHFFFKKFSLEISAKQQKVLRMRFITKEEEEEAKTVIARV